MANALPIVIVGGGCAGLSLARNLARSRRRPPQTVVLEPRVNYVRDRTWCFWAEDAGDDEPLIAQRWRAWRFSSQGKSVVHRPGGRWAYHCLPSDRFYADAQAAIDDSPDVDLLRGVRVLSVNEERGVLRIETDRGLLRAKQLVDTRPPTAAEVASAILLQTFVAVEVQLSTALSEPHLIGLMDDMAVDDLGLRFNYVLPLTRRRLFVEATRFSAFPVPEERLGVDLEHALQAVIGDSTHQVVYSERGMIPMGLPRRRQSFHRNWVTAGAPNGAVRASTGYAYRRIQAWARTCSDRITQRGEVVGQPPDPPLLRWMDNLFLNVLRNQPHLAPDFFMRLAHNVTPLALTRFLSDSPRLDDARQVISALPPRPFMRQLLDDLLSKTRTPANVERREST